MSETLADRIQREAYEAFDLWLADQPDSVQDLCLLDQINAYGQARKDSPNE